MSKITLCLSLDLCVRSFFWNPHYLSKHALTVSDCRVLSPVILVVSEYPGRMGSQSRKVYEFIIEAGKNESFVVKSDGFLDHKFTGFPPVREIIEMSGN